MGRRNKNKKDDINPDAWLATYADTITLILTFFVLLYATSVVDMEKFKNISNALKGQFSGESMFSTGSSTSANSPIDSVLVDKNDKSEIEKTLKEKVNNSNLQNSVTVKDDGRGILLELDNSILFDSGSSDLKIDSKVALNKVYDMIKAMKNKIAIEGHTDNIPVKSSKHESNWDLSSSRAVSVVKYFVEEKGMDPKLFSATGCGEYQPLVSNNTEKGRAENRRVNILITID